MNCPACKSRRNIEVVMHSDGYAKSLLECPCCGAIWATMHGEGGLQLKKLDLGL